MAKEVIIGRVGVKVTAIMEEGLRQKLKGEVEKLEQQLQKDAGAIEFEAELKDSDKIVRETKDAHADAQKVADKPIEAEIKVDSSGVVAETKAAVAEAEAKAGDIDVEVKVNTSGLRGMQNRLKTMLNAERPEIDIKPTVDRDSLSSIENDIKNTFDAINANRNLLKVKVAGGGKLDSGVKADVRRQIAELDGEMKGLLRKRMAIALGVDLDKSQVMGVKAALAQLTRPETKTIHVRTQGGTDALTKSLSNANKQIGNIATNLSGSRLLWDLHKKKFEAFKNFDQVALRAGTIATGLASASAYATQLAGDILSVANDLGSIVGLAPVLASGLGMVVAQGIIFKQAFSDIADRFPEMIDGFSQLGSTIRDEFWGEASSAFQNMYKKLFPALSKGMANLAASTGGMFAELSDGMTKFGAGRIGPIFDNWAKSTDILTGSMSALSYIMLETLKKGSEYLPRVAKGFTDAANGMAEWLSNASASGELDAWINRAIENTKALGSVLWDTGRMFAILGDYAREAGAATLQGMAASMAGVVEVIKSAGFKAGFIAILASANQFMDQLTEVFQSRAAALGQVLVTAITGSLPALGTGLSSALDGLLKGLTNPEFAAGVVQMFTLIGGAIGQLSTALEVIGPKLGVVFGFIGGMFAALLPVVGSFMTELATILGQIHVPVDNLLAALGPALQSIVQGLAPFFAGLGSALATIATALTPFVTTLGQLGPIIQPVAAAVGGLVATLAQTLAPILPVIAQAIVSVMSIVAPMIAQLVTAVQGLLVALQPIIQLVIANLPLIAAIVGTVIGIIISMITGLIQGVTLVITGIVNIVKGAVALVTAIINGDWKGAWDALVQIVKGVFQLLLGGILIWLNASVLAPLRGGLFMIAAIWKGGWNSVLIIARAVWTSIASWIRTRAAIIITDIVLALAKIKGFWSAGWAVLKVIVKTAWTVIKSAVSLGVKAFMAPIKLAMSTIKTVFSTGMKSAEGAVTTGIGRVVAFFSGLPGKVVSALGNLGNLLYNAGQQILDGLINGVKSMISGLQGVFGSITNMIPDWKGPLPRDKVLLYPAGQAIMGGLIKGVGDKVPELRNELRDITKLIEGTEFSLSPIDTSELDRLDKARVLAGAQLVGADSADATASAGMVNNFEMHMGNQYTPEDVSGEILYNLRRAQRAGVYRKEGS